MDKHDEAVLTATPAAFLDRKSKAASLLDALRSPPEYPLSKGLTLPYAKAILDASFRAKPNFVKVQDDRFSTAKGLKGFVYYYLDDEKYGLVRWAVKNKEVSLQARRKGRWVNLAQTDMLLVQAALAVLEHVARRIESEVLASTVAGWVTVREVSSERGAAKRDAELTIQKIQALAFQAGLAEAPADTLEYTSVQERKKAGLPFDVSEASVVHGRVQGRINDAYARLQKQFFASADVPAPASVYNLDHPPVILATPFAGLWIDGPGVKVHFESKQVSISDFNGKEFGGHTFFELFGSDFIVHPRMFWATANPSRAVYDAIARVLRGYGIKSIDLRNGTSNNNFDAMTAAGFFDINGQGRMRVPVAPRANPRRRARRR